MNNLNKAFDMLYSLYVEKGMDVNDALTHVSIKFNLSNDEIETVMGQVFEAAIQDAWEMVG